MKLTLKRDLPLLLAALLVIWGLWYARPIGVDTLYPELEPDIIEVYLSDFTTYRHEDRRLKLTAGTEEFDDLWSEIRELRFRRFPLQRGGAGPPLPGRDRGYLRQIPGNR